MFEQSKKHPKEFVKEEKGVHQSLYKAVMSGSSSPGLGPIAHLSKDSAALVPIAQGTRGSNSASSGHRSQMGSPALGSRRMSVSASKQAIKATSQAGSGVFKIPLSPSLKAQSKSIETVERWSDDDEETSPIKPKSTKLTGPMSAQSADTSHKLATSSEIGAGGGSGGKGHGQGGKKTVDGDTDVYLDGDTDVYYLSEIERPKTASETGQQNHEELEAEILEMEAEIEAQMKAQMEAQADRGV